MKRASSALGFADWKQALEKVKTMHPPPGGQAGVIRDLMFEAVDYLRANDLLTVPAVAAESLRMIMMTPERQLVNPFFTGGNQISVSYPTDTMEYEARIQSMRGNNTPFSHATAFHEMIPGHNLVFYTTARFSGYRPSLGGNSPFYSEGWPLYWEMQMYDMGFHDTPEKKIGALFWRMHRCARIIFSLKFHMGEWSPQECVDFLVDRVGFERDNATAKCAARSRAATARSTRRRTCSAGSSCAACGRSWWTAARWARRRSTTRFCARARCRSRCCAWRSAGRS